MWSGNYARCGNWETRNVSGKRAWLYQGVWVAECGISETRGSRSTGTAACMSRVAVKSGEGRVQDRRKGTLKEGESRFVLIKGMVLMERTY